MLVIDGDHPVARAATAPSMAEAKHRARELNLLISSCHFDARLLDVSFQSNADGPDEDRWFG